MATLAVCSLQAQSLTDGLAAFEKGDYAAAEKAFEKNSDNPRANAFLALTQAATNRCGEAEPALEAAFQAKSDPNIRKLTGLALARCRIAAERFDAALDPLSALRRDYPDDADVLYENARLHLKAWNGIVEEMFERTPDSFRVNQLSAEIFEIQGQYDEAVAEYRKAIEKAPRTINLHYRLGRALLMQSHEPASLEAARLEFEAELELNPNDAVAEYQVFQILQVQGDEDAAVWRLIRAVDLDPTFPEALVALGRQRVKDKDYADAIMVLNEALKHAPKSESAHYSLMLAYRNAGRREDAERIKKALDELQASPEGEFTDFLKRIGEAPAN